MCTVPLKFPSTFDLCLFFCLALSLPLTLSNHDQAFTAQSPPLPTICVSVSAPVHLSRLLYPSSSPTSFVKFVLRVSPLSELPVLRFFHRRTRSNPRARSCHQIGHPRLTPAPWLIRPQSPVPLCSPPPPPRCSESISSRQPLFHRLFASP
ncbi:hypothetical protein BDW71DRAFT_141016 [Aspergillus fruticulosus]